MMSNLTSPKTKEKRIRNSENKVRDAKYLIYNVKAKDDSS